MKSFDTLTEAEKMLRSLIFAVEVKDKHNKKHPIPLGEEYLAHILHNAKKLAYQLEIPLVEIDEKLYY
jgi:hypothetical protein